MSLPEVLLWQELRKRPQELTFRRQHPAGPYSLDFYCTQAKLAIEVDGESHNRGERPNRDLARDTWLKGQGVRTLRIRAADVLRDLNAVLTYILAEALPPPPPAAPAVPLPRSDAPREE